MGLGLYFHLRAPISWPIDRVRSVVEIMRECALARGFAEVDDLRENKPWRLYPKERSKTSLPRFAESTAGVYFRTWPGEGCETVFFGMCWFPATFAGPDGEIIQTGWGEGWHFTSGCKTHPADRISRKNFLKCHLGVIAILDVAGEAGFEAEVGDDYGYWQDRDLAALHADLDAGRQILGQLLVGDGGD